MIAKIGTDWVCELCIICLQASQLPLDFLTPSWQLHGVAKLDSSPLELHLSWLYSLVINPHSILAVYQPEISS